MSNVKPLLFWSLFTVLFPWIKRESFRHHQPERQCRPPQNFPLSSPSSRDSKLFFYILLLLWSLILIKFEHNLILKGRGKARGEIKMSNHLSVSDRVTQENRSVSYKTWTKNCWKINSIFTQRNNIHLPLLFTWHYHTINKGEIKQMRGGSDPFKGINKIYKSRKERGCHVQSVVLLTHRQRYSHPCL